MLFEIRTKAKNSFQRSYYPIQRIFVYESYFNFKKKGLFRQVQWIFIAPKSIRPGLMNIWFKIKISSFESSEKQSNSWATVTLVKKKKRLIKKELSVALISDALLEL